MRCTLFRKSKEFLAGVVKRAYAFVKRFWIRFPRIGKALSIAVFVCICAIVCIPLPHPLFFPDYSSVVYGEEGEILRVSLNRREQWHFPPHEKSYVTDKLRVCTLLYEDEYFFVHQGINPVSLVKSFLDNMDAGEVVRGGSTISMQVARLIRPKERTYGNKILEILQAFKIEVLYTKKKILSLYVSHAPYGGNIVGAEAAALRYFGKTLDNLSWAESATLAVLPNSPGVVSHFSNEHILRYKRDKLLEKLRDKGKIDEETYRLSLLEDTITRLYPYPFHAPHFTRYLMQNMRLRGRIYSTLNARLNEQLRHIAESHARYFRSLGVHNIAIIVAETESGKVRGYIGSQDYFDTLHEGMVDGVIAPRSSGSLLKPFLYGLAIDDGMLLPDMLIKDIPRNYSGFTPMNATEGFDGLVTMREALVRSLNIPAIDTLSRYGTRRFYLFLKKAGVSTLFRTHEEYGLSFVIGGAEVRLFDMAALFRGLGRLGRFSPLRVLESERKGISKELISAGTAFEILEIIRELNRPGAEYYWEQYENTRPLAWKTGTSYGGRDAWAVGVSPEWTIGVWAGNFSGEGNPNIKGAHLAGPVLFDVFNTISKERTDIWFERPRDYQTIHVCKESGYPAGENCEHKVKRDIPKHFTPTMTCPYHKRFPVDTEHGYLVCPRCWTPGKFEYKSFLVYPPDVLQCLRDRGLYVERLPRHNPQCETTGGLGPDALTVIYPLENTEIIVPRDFGGEREKVLFRAAHRDKNARVFWYIDDTYLGETTRIHSLSADLTAGRHTLTLVDEEGRRAIVRFYSYAGE